MSRHCFCHDARAHEIEVPLRVELFDFGVMLWRHGVTGKHCSEWRRRRSFSLLNGQESLHFICPHFLRMTNAMKTDEAFDPLNIGCLRARAVAVCAEGRGVIKSPPLMSRDAPVM